MNGSKRAWFALVGLSIAAALAGCQVAPTTNTGNAPASATPPQANAPTSATPAPTAQRDAGAASMPVTLPVLDAFFADDSFANDVKARLQLTDEQLEKLRTVARQETASLRESDQGDDARGTTTAATTRAAEQIKAAIGDDKAAQLFAFVRERWTKGDAPADVVTANALPDKPNTVPTDTRIVVNAPAYRMDVFKGGQLAKTYKIGIGYPEFPLPEGVRTARTIIFNPTWTPPDEPWVEGSSKVKAGQKVEAGSPLNPLGPIKIPIGLPSLIHGGKSAAKLGGFASHGCVGLTNPQVQDFARVLAGLSGAELTAEDITGYAKNKTETKNVQLQQPVPVELRYETIVVEDGKLHIYRDVYDRGANTEENLRRVLEVYGVKLDDLTEPERKQVMDALAEMAHDAQGKLAGGTDNKNANTKNDNAKNDNTAASKNSNKPDAKESARVTRTVKGKKEIVIELAALKGKGYPAPVNLDTGSGTTTTRPQAAKTSKRG